MKNYFKDGIELEITNKRGRILVSEILDLRTRNNFVGKIFSDNNIWGKYRTIVMAIAKEDVISISKEEAIEYDQIFRQAFFRTIPGYTLLEGETALKIAQRRDIDVSNVMALDLLTKQYTTEKNKPNSKMIRKDENFSLILDYDMLLRERGIKKEGQYSPIAEMEQAIRDGRFGEGDTLSREEFAFVLKMLQKPQMLDSDINMALGRILEKTDIKFNIGPRECKTLLLSNQEFLQSMIKMFPNLRGKYILKELNAYAIGIFEEIKNNPDKPVTEEVKEICRNYLQNYFKDGMEIDIMNDVGRKLFREISSARKNSFISEEYSVNKVWRKYREVVDKLITREVTTLSEEEIQQYDKMLEFHFGNVVTGYANPEAEMALKIAQRRDIDVTQLKSLDYLSRSYEIEKNDSNSKSVKMDEVFSIILDYDIILETRNVERPGKYSPIKEMSQKIKEGKFGQNKSLSKEEFAFAMKMLQTPELLDSDVNQKLCEILGRADIQFDIGEREINTLLENKELFSQITDIFPNLQDGILKQIDANIYSILKNISDKQRKITPEEMKKYSQYLSKYFDTSLDKNYDTQEMSQLFNLALDLAYPEMRYNIQELEDQEETVEFFEKEFEEKQVFEKYDSKIDEIVKKCQQGQAITPQEFERYDQILYELSYRIKFDVMDNIKTIEALESRSKELQLSSKTIENNIEKYIDLCINNQGEIEEQGFYEIILSYYGRQLEGDAINISENASISHLIRAAQKGRLPQNIATIILDKLEERKEKSPSIEIPDAQDLEKYMQVVAEIRLQQGRMPRECCDFIIKQAILQTQDMSKYRGMVERALEDIAEYELENSQISGYYVAVVNQPFLGKKTNGLHNGGYERIYLSRQTLQSEGAFRMLETILHENAHAEQEAQINDAQLNGDTYKMLKELILIRNDKSFYDVNYNYMYNEIDARTKGYIKRLKLLRGIGLSDAEIAVLRGADVQEKIIKHCKDYEKGKIKKAGQEMKEVNTMFLELLRKNPQLLNEYPDLQMEFELQGENIQRKGIVSMLREYEQMIGLAENQREVGRISSLFNEILLNGGAVLEERAQEELKQLIAYKSENPIINAYKSKILKNKFSSQMVTEATMKSMYENHSVQERLAVQQGVKLGLDSKKQPDTIQQPNNSERGEG